jgi:hypothetical protein
MFFRRAHFLAVGGCDPTLLVMEEADLCIRFHRLGPTRLVNHIVITSDRRIAAWGALQANWNYLNVGARWGLGFSKGLERHYCDVRWTDRPLRLSLFLWNPGSSRLAGSTSARLTVSRPQQFSVR